MQGKALIAPNNTLPKAIKGAYGFISDPILSLKTFHENFGDIAQVSYFEPKQIMITHPDYVKQMLQENHRNYTKSLKYKELKHFLGEGLLTSEGDYWLQQRRVAQPAFHKQKLVLLYQIMQECTEKAINEWDEKLKKSDFMDMSEEMTSTTLKIAGKALGLCSEFG